MTAYIRLVDVEKAQHWSSGGHFFGAVAEAMRRILVDNALRKRSLNPVSIVDRRGARFAVNEEAQGFCAPKRVVVCVNARTGTVIVRSGSVLGFGAGWKFDFDYWVPNSPKLCAFMCA